MPHRQGRCPKGSGRTYLITTRFCVSESVAAQVNERYSCCVRVCHHLWIACNPVIGVDTPLGELMLQRESMGTTAHGYVGENHPLAHIHALVVYRVAGLDDRADPVNFASGISFGVIVVCDLPEVHSE